MPRMLQAINLSVRRGVKLLFENTNFQIHPGQKVGLTGANGTGKSSLFSLIQNNLHSDVGDCIYPDHWTIAHVAQEIPDGEKKAIDFILDGDADRIGYCIIWKMEKSMQIRRKGAGCMIEIRIIL